MSKIIDLHNAGFRADRIPVINTMTPNVCKGFSGFHISYCGRSDGYGCPTTAFVIKNTCFFILKGNHALDLKKAADSGGVQAVLDMFLTRYDQIHMDFSDHLTVCGLRNDIFGITPYALEVIGQEGIDKILKAHNQFESEAA